MIPQCQRDNFANPRPPPRRKITTGSDPNLQENVRACLNMLMEMIDSYVEFCFVFCFFVFVAVGTCFNFSKYAGLVYCRFGGS